MDNTRQTTKAVTPFSRRDRTQQLDAHKKSNFVLCEALAETLEHLIQAAASTLSCYLAVSVSG